jgi:hypothetical protein
MPARRYRRRVARLGAGLVSICLVLVSVGLVNAGSGVPSSIGVTENGLTVHASGTWSWAEMLTNARLSFNGIAISWGDVGSGNTVGPYHLGDGTAATNFVMETATQGSSGPWGPVDHTYAQAGKYTICVITYDLGEVKPFKTTGYHGLRAGGTDRNTDNSVDQDNQPPVQCVTVDVVETTTTPTVAPTSPPTSAPTSPPTSAPTVPTTPAPPTAGPGTGVPVAAPLAAATAFEEFQGITATNGADTRFEAFLGGTAVPGFTPPPTGTNPGSARPNEGGPGLPLLLLIMSGVFLVIALKPLKGARR